MLEDLPIGKHTKFDQYELLIRDIRFLSGNVSKAFFTLCRYKHTHTVHMCSCVYALTFVNKFRIELPKLC